MTTKSTTPPVTEIAYILDMSGSMYSFTEAAITGFNDFLREQQEVEGKARISLILFDDQYELPIDNLPVGEVCPIDTETYHPRGSTALLDAIGKTIRKFRKRTKDLPKKDRPDQVIFAIFTDGLENASRKYTWQDIAQMIQKRQKKDGWEFLFLAAGQDAIATAAQMNIQSHNAASVTENNMFSPRDSGRAMSRKVKAMREMDTSATDLVAPMESILREEESREV